MSRIIEPFEQFFDGEGDPLSQGWLKFTESGTNLTDRDTFADDNLQIANTNPLQLDSEGRCPNVFGTGSYRVTLFAYNPADPYNVGTQIDQKDPVSESASGSVTFGIWDTTEIYAAGAIVIGSDGNYYKSLSSANEANDPISTPSKWERIDYSHFYNAGISYDIADRVIDAATGIVYISLVDTNLNNTPSSSPTKWKDQVKLNQDAITAIALRVTQNETDIGTNTTNIGTNTTNIGTNTTNIETNTTDIADTYNKTESDGRYLNEASNLSDLDSASTARDNLGLQAATFTTSNTSVGISTTLNVTAPSGYQYLSKRETFPSSVSINSISSDGKTLSVTNSSVTDPYTVRLIWKLDRW